MKLSEWKEEFYFHSSQVSKLVRQVALAGIAAIWLFKNSGAGEPIIPSSLIWPVLMLFLCLGLDLLQYLYSTVLWSVFHRYHEVHTKTEDEPDPEIEANPNYNIPSWTLFALKVLSMVFAYVGIFSFLWEKVFPNSG